MLNNIGLPGLLLIAIAAAIIVLPIWLIMRSSKRKSVERERIANALEEIAKNKND